MPESTGLSKARVRKAYEFIRAHRDQYSVQAMCRILEVAPSGSYDWLQQPISNRAKEDARLLRLIRASFVASQGVYGHHTSGASSSPRVGSAPSATPSAVRHRIPMPLIGSSVAA